MRSSRGAVSRIFGALFLSAFGVFASAQTQTPDAAKSCYEELDAAQRPANARALFVVVDETTVMPKETATSAYDALKALAKGGTFVAIFRFSGYTKERTTQVVNRLTIEPDYELPKKSDESVKKSAAIDKRNSEIKKCLTLQRKTLPESAWRDVEEVTKKATSDIQQSEVLGTLKQLEQVIASRPEKDKVILMLSDMLEHSGFISFYQKGAMRQLDPTQELKVIEAQRLLPNLSGARVFVVGASLFPAGEKTATNGADVRNAKVLQSHQDFWKQYFAKANAKLVEFGQPNLLGEVR